MREVRELQTQIDELVKHIALQDVNINRLRLTIRAALAALQTGNALDVVVAIKLLRQE
jgi:hypothetical protein